MDLPLGLFKVKLSSYFSYSYTLIKSTMPIITITTAVIKSGIHNGANIIHHDHVIIPHNFNIHTIAYKVVKIPGP